MSLIGGNKTVFLDEPSTGMDPYTRRALWETLKHLRKGRTIVLTTHLMEEADFLGDRIAIMAEGRLKCMGTSLFLKRKFGLGYSITCSKGQRMSDAQTLLLVHSVKLTIPRVELVTNIALEISFRAPFDEAGKMATLLHLLETEKKRFGITATAVGVTKLEEVFIQAGKDQYVKIDHIGEEDFDKLGQEEAVTSQLDREDDEGFLSSSAAAPPPAPPPGGQPAGAPRQSMDVSAVGGVKPRTSSVGSAGSGGGGPIDSGVVDIFEELQSHRVQRNPFSQMFFHIGALIAKNFRIGSRNMNVYVCQFILPVTFSLVTCALLAYYARSDPPRMVMTAEQYATYPYRDLYPQLPSVGGEGTSHFSQSCTPGWRPIPSAASSAKDFDGELRDSTLSWPRPRYSSWFNANFSTLFSWPTYTPLLQQEGYLFYNSSHRP
eukprot:GHVU01017522.1.p1 GENE.GHVU01017522.1~~GHVU01017522.1.p1  ORF type:complete len:433 (-),score=102.42 GHVU01017522.1:2711-4009(-)